MCFKISDHSRLMAYVSFSAFLGNIFMLCFWSSVRLLCAADAARTKWSTGKVFHWITWGPHIWGP